MSKNKKNKHEHKDGVRAEDSGKHLEHRGNNVFGKSSGDRIQLTNLHHSLNHEHKDSHANNKSGMGGHGAHHKSEHHSEGHKLVHRSGGHKTIHHSVSHRDTGKMIKHHHPNHHHGKPNHAGHVANKPQGITSHHGAHHKEEKKELEGGKQISPVENKLTQMKLISEEDEKPKGQLIEKYVINVDGAKVTVEIRKDELGTKYDLFIPKVDIATSVLLESIRNELVSITSVSMKELVDPSLFSTIKERFLRDATKLIKERLPRIEGDLEEVLVGKLIQDMLGLGEIEFLINDPSLEEIVIPSAKEKIRVYSKKYGWLETNIKIGDEEIIINYSNIIARRIGRQITVLNPLLDAHLVTGDRVNAVLYPINTKGNTITITKFARDPFTIIDFINNKTCDLDTTALLWLAIEYEMNILISGGTGSGKTSFLNACMPFIPPNQRIISIEDTRE